MSGSEPVREDLESLKKILMEILPQDGQSLGNTKARREFVKAAKRQLNLELDDEAYWDIRNRLIEDGEVKTGRGKGGSIHRTTVSIPQAKPSATIYKTESDLYLPVQETINKSWVKNYGIEDFVSEITAQQGGRVTGGKWTRPDISLFAIRIYPYVPGKSVELITFEIKHVGAYGVEGVFETAAHSAFAHRSFLMLYVPNDSDNFEGSERLTKEAERFGVGLVTFEDPKDWDTYNIRVEAEHKTPDPSELCDFIKVQFAPERREKIQRMIR